MVPMGAQCHSGTRVGFGTVGGDASATSPTMTDLADDAAALASAEPRGGFARFTRDSVVFASGAVAGKVVGLLLLPIVSRALGPAEYGRLDLLSTLGSGAITVLWLGIDVAFVRTIAPLPRGPLARATTGSFFATLVFLALPWVLGIWLLAPALSQWLFGTDTYAQAARVAALVVASGTFQIATMTVFRARSRPTDYAIVVATGLMVNGVLVVLLLSTWQQNAETVLVAWVVGQSVAALVGVVLLGRDGPGAPSGQLARRLILLGLPLAPAVALSWIGEFANRAILLTASGAEEVGYLSVALRVASVAMLAVAGFKLAWQPRAFATGTSDAARSQIARDGERILAVLALVVGVVAALGPSLVHVLAGPEFAPSSRVIGPLLIAAMSAGIVLVASTPSALVKRMRDIGFAEGFGAIVAITANLVLAPRFAALGTAVAIAAGQTVASLLVGLAARRLKLLPIRWRRVAILWAATAAVALIPTIATEPSLIVQIGSVASIVVVALGLGLASSRGIVTGRGDHD